MHHWKRFRIDTTVFQDKTAVYYTLGRKLNFRRLPTIGKTLREGRSPYRTQRRKRIFAVKYPFCDGNGRQEVPASHSPAGEATSRRFCRGDRMLRTAETRRCGENQRRDGYWERNRRKIAPISGRFPETWRGRSVYYDFITLSVRSRLLHPGATVRVFSESAGWMCDACSYCIILCARTQP